MQDTEMAEGRKIPHIVSGDVFLPRQALYLPKKCLRLPGTFSVWMSCLCLRKEDLKKKKTKLSDSFKVIQSEHLEIRVGLEQIIVWALDLPSFYHMRS